MAAAQKSWERRDLLGKSGRCKSPVPFFLVHPTVSQACHQCNSTSFIRCGFCMKFLCSEDFWNYHVFCECVEWYSHPLNFLLHIYSFIHQLYYYLLKWDDSVYENRKTKKQSEKMRHARESNPLQPTTGSKQLAFVFSLYFLSRLFWTTAINTIIFSFFSSIDPHFAHNFANLTR